MPLWGGVAVWRGGVRGRVSRVFGSCVRLVCVAVWCARVGCFFWRDWSSVIPARVSCRRCVCGVSVGVALCLGVRVFGGGVRLVVSCVVCELHSGREHLLWPSCVGHTVDALASGADEGRGGLR